MIWTRLQLDIFPVIRLQERKAILCLTNFARNHAETSESIGKEKLDTDKLLASAQTVIDAANEIMNDNPSPIIDDDILIFTNFFETRPLNPKNMKFRN